MLKREYQSKTLNILEIYYLEDVSQFLKKYDTSNIDIIFLYQVRENYQNKLGDFTTLHIDLTKDNEDIFKDFHSKNTKNEVRKNIKDDGVTYIFKDNLSDKDIKDFVNDLNWFMKKKDNAVNVNFVTNQAKDFVKNIYLTLVEKDGVALASHLYIFSGNCIRYKLGISYRHAKIVDSNIIGRSNRGLHWFDMQLFKEKGFEIYDFGGIAIDTEDKNLLGINRFKEGFSKNRISEYTGSIGVSFKGKIALFLHKLLVFIKK